MLERIARRIARWKARRGDPLEAPDVRRLGEHWETDLVFADDARQREPSRPGMRPLIAVGGLTVSANAVRTLTIALDGACADAGFPSGEEFKWSPSRDQWMHRALVGNARRAFFLRVLGLLQEHEARASVVVVDGAAKSATKAATAEEDATRLFIERVEHLCTEHGSHGMVVADRPGGGRREEDAFLLQCLEMIQRGTQYVMPVRIIHVVSAPSHLSRLLQCADLITSATLARVAGEREFAPPIFDAIRPLLYRDGERTGGYGLKIHPAFRYLNLYHWLLGDTHFWRLQMGFPLPKAGYLYSADEWTQ